METRTVATFEAQWFSLGVEFHASFWPSDFLTYCNDDNPRDEVIEVMLKDFRSLDGYAKKGWQTSRTIPVDVRITADRLQKGFKIDKIS